ncbi:MAG TPA: TrbI/VirB10 family protein [Coxiellaceae bacterium]|nr:TrbI/VirB10 family protein [Coxiellaceae bacterium]
MNEDRNDTLNETQAASPVAEVTKKLNIKPLLALVLIASVFIYCLIPSHQETKTNESLQEPSPAKALTASAPSLPQITVKQGPSPDELQQQLEEEKLQKIRILAPGRMYSADQTSKGSIAHTNSAVLGDSSNDNNSQFISRVSSDQAPVVMVTRIKHPSYTLAQGTLIDASLETQITSDLPGMVRAVTSQNIYSENGDQILLPRGSRLIGQYTSSVAQGQNRVFVVWQRAIRPDHIDIQLNSPGTDPLGAAGIGADGVNRHFWAQFGNALLLSMIGAGTATLGVNDTQDQFNSAAAYREALSNSFSESASNSLESTGAIKPSIFINQGKKISVFVVQDLDFYNELRSR